MKTLSSMSKSILSKREQEVLKLICLEFTTAEMAEHLFLSPRTIEGYRKRIVLKIGAKNTAGIVIYAIREQIIRLD